MATLRKATRKIRIEEVENGFLVYVVDSTPGTGGGDRVLERRVFIGNTALLDWVAEFVAETWPEKAPEQCGHEHEASGQHPCELPIDHPGSHWSSKDNP
jgi:hypothetical protein